MIPLLINNIEADKLYNKYKKISINACIIINNKILLCQRYNTFSLIKIFRYIKLFILNKDNNIYKIKISQLIDFLNIKEKKICNHIIKYYYNILIMINIELNYIELKNKNNLNKLLIKYKKYFNNILKNNSENNIYYILISYYIYIYKISLNLYNTFENTYILPGGTKNNNDKTIFDTLYREIKEEINLDIIKYNNTDYIIDNKIFYLNIKDYSLNNIFHNIIFIIKFTKNNMENEIILNFKKNIEVKKIKYLEYNNDIENNIYNIYNNLILNNEIITIKY